MSGHVVVPVEVCRYGNRPSWDMGGNPTRCDQSPADGRTRMARCYSCMGDGTRVVLDQAVPVSHHGWQWEDGGVHQHTGQHDRPKVWVEGEQ